MKSFLTNYLKLKKIVAILDKYPINTGHILILPKVHTDTLVDISNDIFIEMLNLSKKDYKNYSREF